MADPTTPRTGLTSSVDLLPLLATIGHNGSRDWLSGNLATGPTLETEFYDYSTERGRLELDNIKDDPRIAPLEQSMLTDIIPGGGAGAREIPISRL